MRTLRTCRGCAFGSIAFMTAVTFVSPRSASAALVAEWDFRNDANLSENVGGTSNVSTVRQGTQSGAANAGISGKFVDDVRLGSFDLPFNATPASYPNAPGLSTTGATGEWQDFMGGTGHQQGTVYSVFKPKYSGNFGGSAVHFNVGSYISDDIIAVGNLETSGGQGRPAIRTRFTTGAGFVSVTNSGSQWLWDNTKWYFLAASWKTGDKAYIYIRELAAETASYFNGSASNVLDTGDILDTELLDVGSIRLDQPPYLGDPFQTNGANAYISLVRLYNEYTTTEKQFTDRFFELMIPEPGSVSLLAVGAAASLRRRRRGT